MAYEDQRLDLTFDTAFGETSVYQVRDDRGETIRVLEVAGSIQSACYLGERYCELVFDYTRRFDAIFDARPQASSVLVLGGGGCSYPKHLIATRPGCHVDVVEVDPGIVDVAYEFFYLDRLFQDYDLERSGRLGILVEDARDYLGRCERPYDAIVSDAFAGPDAVETLGEQAALRDAHRLLGDEGVLAANVVAALEGDEADPLRRLVDALGSEFGQVGVVRVGDDDPAIPDNLIVLASASDLSVPGMVRLYP
jgi:spermidine synthase